MTKQSDISKLLVRLNKFIDAANEARGNAQGLVKAAPLEIHFYNIATGTKNELEGFKAMLEDFEGTYLSDKKGSQ